MAQAIRSDGLLELADRLGQRGVTTGGRPKNIDLRRSMSAAYYALFHCITYAVAKQLLPSGSEDDRSRLTRSLQHVNVRRVCDWVLGASKPPKVTRPMVNEMAAEARIVDVALTFQILQERRYEADYDHLAEFSKPSVLNSIDEARNACQTMAALTGDANLARFLACIAMRPTLR